MQGRSPNKHNDFFIFVEPLEDVVAEAIKNGEIKEGKIKKKDEQLFNKLSALGIDHDEIRQYREIYKGCVFQDRTRGIVAIGEVIEMVMQAFEQIVNEGILAREPCYKMKVCLVDARLHEDSIHRGPSQVIPAVRHAIKEALKDAGTILYEPIQIIQVDTPMRFIGDVTAVLQSKRGQILNVEQEGEFASLRVKVPVAEMFTLSNDLRGVSEGRANFYLVDQFFEPVPRDLQQRLIKQIRERKGLKEED
jgi:elongation factor 2